jgi:hypothetical protein
MKSKAIEIFVLLLLAIGSYFLYHHVYDESIAKGVFKDNLDLASLKEPIIFLAGLMSAMVAHSSEQYLLLVLILLYPILFFSLMHSDYYFLALGTFIMYGLLISPLVSGHVFNPWAVVGSLFSGAFCVLAVILTSILGLFALSGGKN